MMNGADILAGSVGACGLARATLPGRTRGGQDAGPPLHHCFPDAATAAGRRTESVIDGEAWMPAALATA